MEDLRARKADRQLSASNGNTPLPPDEPKPLQSVNGKPTLRLPGTGHLVSSFAAELGAMLQGHNLFARKGCAFTLDHDGQKLEPADPAWLRTWVEKHVVPYVLTQAGKIELKICKTMPDDTARAVLRSPQFLEQLPLVERFHPCPMPWLRENGKIELLPAGLDSDSRTFTADPGFQIKSMPLADARAMFDYVLEEFAWPEDGGRSKAVQISAMLTVFASGIMPQGSTRPVFLFVANSEGSGKTLLAILCGTPYRETPVETAPREDAEWAKKLLSAVIAGRRLILLDNLKGHLNAPALEAYTTSPHFSGRILGVSKEFQGEAGATVLITGNGLTISPDLRRRSLFVELFLRELRAEDRAFKRTLDPVAIQTARPDILSALWSLVREWDKSGRPKSSLLNSSFPRWTDTIAGIVEFAGYGCPTAPAEIEGMGDTDTADFSTLAGLMQPARRYTFEELATAAEDAGLFDHITGDRDKNEGGLSRRAKKKLSGVLGRFDRRRVTAKGVFRMEGKGHSRRYSIAGQHDRHDKHDTSPQLEKSTFPIKPEYHAHHAHHAQNDLISQDAEPRAIPSRRLCPSPNAREPVAGSQPPANAYS